MEKICFVGMGNMAQALATGFINSGKIKKENLYAYAPNQEKLKKNAERIGFIPCKDCHEMTKKCDTIIFACKPYQFEEVAKNCACFGKNVISIMLGWNYERIIPITGGGNIQFIMPNTPAMVNEGVFLFEKENTLQPEEREFLIELFRTMGTVIELPSELMGVGGAISGCGPAFMDMIIEAYADAAVKYGIPREIAYTLVSQTMIGSGWLQLKTGTHPGILKDAVCSPGGSTIRGVDSLEKDGLRGILINCIDAVMKK